MDVLSDILDKISINSSFYYRARLSGQWGVDMPKDSKMARFHIVTEGDFWLKVEGNKDKTKVSAGDIVIIFHGKQHLILKNKKIKAIQAKVFLEKANKHIPGELLEYKNGKDETTNIICGHFHFQNNKLHPVIKNLPTLIHIKKEDNDHSPWLNTILDFIDFESKLLKPGKRTLIKKLTEVIFIQAIRVFLENNNNSNILNLINDQQISRSIDAIHSSPEKKWTLNDLALVAGLSRTVYSKRFKKISGMTPHNYLTSWRMEMARNLILNTDKSTGEIAETVGYQADEHFQKAFKKENGLTPSRYRKEQ